MLETGLEGESAIVTGAASGIGAAIARRLADAGVDVALFDVDTDGIERTATAVRDRDQRATVHTVDVTDEDAIEHGVEAAVDAHDSVSVLVNNAGVQERDTVLDLERNAWDRQFAVNATGTYLCSRHVARHFVDTGTSGRIVNVASQAGQEPPAELSAYAASKAAVIAFTKSFAQEIGEYGVRVNAVCPGPAETPLLMDLLEEVAAETDQDVAEIVASIEDEEIPLGRIADPQDIADPVVFLASDLSRHISGQALNVTGGQTIV